MKLSLFKNRTERPFWTSDHPVNRYNQIDARPHGNLGLQSKGITMYFPLTPKLSLCLCDPNVYGWLPSKYEIVDAENVMHQNSLQVYYSTRYVFSDSKDFSFAEKITRENPLLKNIDRKRLSVE